MIDGAMMYFLSYDKRNSRIRHKHSSLNVVGWLVRIEFGNCAGRICDQTMLCHGIPASEVERIFKNCYPGESVPELQEQLTRIRAYTDALPENDVDAAEVRAQAESLRDNDAKPYTYIKGAFLPAVHTTAAPEQQSQPLQPVQRPARGSVQTTVAQWRRPNGHDLASRKICAPFST